MKLFCIECDCDVEARLTDGAECYSHRKELASLPFWKCDACKNFVGCHHKTSNPTRPLGCIPNKEMKEARQHIHRILDPIWKSGSISRSKIYKMISDATGKEYHTAGISSIEDARVAYKAIQEIKHNLNIGSK